MTAQSCAPRTSPLLPRLVTGLALLSGCFAFADRIVFVLDRVPVRAILWVSSGAVAIACAVALLVPLHRRYAVFMEAASTRTRIGASVACGLGDFIQIAASAGLLLYVYGRGSGDEQIWAGGIAATDYVVLPVMLSIGRERARHRR